MSPLTPVDNREVPPTSIPRFHHRKSSGGSVLTSSTPSTYENRASPRTMRGNTSTGSPTANSAATEMTFDKMRAALEEANQRDATAKAALAKSDAVILELRSSIRQLKRQVEQAQQEKDESHQAMENLKREFSNLEHSAASSLQEKQQLHQEEVSQLQSQLHISETQAKEQVVGELQVQLDRAHAQILTADMVRKELEDTLEAEQYTWELRVQDQERQIVLLQEECQTLRDDLAECRRQWREAEQEWTEEIRGLQAEVRDGSSFAGKLRQLEKEREELQGCLDEAMKELEAVDRELRQNPNVLEPLQHLYRWLMERNGHEEKEASSDVNELVELIEGLIEEAPNDSMKVHVAELEAQISVYRGDLKAREESSAELRASLKEAVGLLKPLQDAVAKTDKEKKELEEMLEHAQRRQRELESKLQANSPVLSPGSSVSRSMPSGDDQGEEGSARMKRDRAQESLKRMLNSTQSRFKELNQERGGMKEENEALHRRIKELESQLIQKKSGDEQDSIQRDVDAEMRESAIKQLQQEVEEYSKELERKERSLEVMEEELQHARETSSNKSIADYESVKSQVEELERELRKKSDIEKELKHMKRELAYRADAEKMLNESLKEALSLLRPLQGHLETAEHERKSLAKQLRSTKKKLAKLEAVNESRSSMSSTFYDNTGDLEVLVEELQREKTQLQPRQEKLQAELVEAKSRFEVMQEKLESVTVENHALVEALKQKEDAQHEVTEELKILRKKLEKSEHELENAKYIATSALMKVEELTMAGISNTASRGYEVDHKGGDEHHPEMERLRRRLKVLEEEVKSARASNEHLEETIQDRDRMLYGIVDQHSQSSPFSRGMEKGNAQTF